MAQARNSDEISALQRFEPLVQDLGLDKGTVMRFLRARNLDFTKAEEMIRAFASWRQNNLFEQALKTWTPAREMLLKYEAYHCGLDGEGRPVFCIFFDKWIPSRPIFELFEPFDFMLFAYKSFLVLFEEIQKSHNQQIILLLDNEGIGFTKIFHEIQNWTAMQTLIDIWQLYEANFPETLFKAYFINTARAFLWGFSLVKPFMTKHTLSKISIFGSDEKKWKSVIFNELSENNIPEKFGGNAKLTHIYDIIYDGVMSTVTPIDS